MEKIKSRRKIYNVTPLTRLPMYRRQSFSYESDMDLPIGALVKIHFNKRNISGVVMEKGNSSEDLIQKKIKTIINAIEKNFLSETQLKLANFISNYYFCPLGVVLKFFMPYIFSTHKAKNVAVPEKSIRIKKKPKLSKLELEIYRRIESKYLRRKKSLLFQNVLENVQPIMTHLINFIINSKKSNQILLLFPETFQAIQAFDHYKKYFDADILSLVHSDVGKNKLCRIWNDVKQGRTKIVIGTRMSLFLPYFDLDAIIVNDEHDTAYKQWDMHPRYHAVKVAEELASFSNSFFLKISSTPSLEAYYEVLKKKCDLIKIDDCVKSNFSIEIIDMNKEKNFQRSFLISPKLKEIIIRVFNKRFFAFMLMNRRGISSYSRCVSCQNILRCPQCRQALMYISEGIYICSKCNYKSNVFVSCPACNGMTFRHYGMGTQKAEKELQNIAPEIVIRRLDSDRQKRKNLIFLYVQEILEQKINVLISTSTSILTLLRGADINFLGVIPDLDSFFSFPDYRTTETAMQKIFQLLLAFPSNLSKKVKSKFEKEIVFQTYNANHIYLKFLENVDYEDFCKYELEQRRILAYPPFSRLVRISFFHKDLKRVEKEVNKLYDIINESNDKAVIFMAKPYTPLSQAQLSKKSMSLLLKLRLKHELNDRLKEIIGNLDNRWKIDVDPLGINS